MSRHLWIFAFFLGALSAGASAQSPIPSPVPSTNSVPSASPAPSATASSLSDFARARIDTMLKSGHADPAWPAASFLAQVPASALDTILAQLLGGLGTYDGIDGAKGVFTARFAKNTDEVDIHIDDENKIDGLFFRAPKLKAASLDAALHDLAVLERMPGLLSFVVMEGRSQRAALNASAPLAVGSTFKLALLAALRARIDAGSMHWSDVVALDPRWKSLPSGIMQTWPDRTPTTLATYVTQMISTPQQIDAWRRAARALPRRDDGRCAAIHTREARCTRYSACERGGIVAHARCRVALHGGRSLRVDDARRRSARLFGQSRSRRSFCIHTRRV